MIIYFIAPGRLIKKGCWKAALIFLSRKHSRERLRGHSWKKPVGGLLRILVNISIHHVIQLSIFRGMPLPVFTLAPFSKED